MSEHDRIYYASRAGEEEQRALAASDPKAVEAHRKLQRIFVERACIGDRPRDVSSTVG